MSLKLLADENFDNRIVMGLLRRKPDRDIVRVQDIGLRTCDDPTILEWAARENRILITHDVSTMTEHANQRVRNGQRMPGLIEIKTNAPTASTIEDILIIVECSVEGEHEGQTIYLPLR